MNGNIDEVQLQLDAGADANEENSIGYSPLHYAAGVGRIDIVELLIEHGANINATDSSNKGATPLDYAHWRDHEEVIETLNAHNAQREHEKGGKGIGQSSLIHDAALDGDIDEVQRQLDAGVDPNLKSSKGATPLFYAVYGGHLEIVELLITRGADVNAVYLNNSVLDQAHSYDDQEMVELLEAHGAEVADKVSGKGDGKGKSAFLSITNLGDGDIIVEFDYGILQTANSINGPWEDVDEVSPVTWTTDQFAKFARLKFSK